jgi:hypothetical protein
MAIAVVVPVVADKVDALTRAQQSYNAGQYDAAIAAAAEARSVPALADLGAIVFARAHLERFRQTTDATDLAAAREALQHVNATALTPRGRVELTIGLGESLFLDDRFGAAAELFEAALARVDLVGPSARDRVFDWWASALDRQAQLGPDADRRAIYGRILRRSEDEWARGDGAATASYWLAASASGVDDIERAWHAAVAGWVRAPFSGASAVSVRADLDRLVVQVIIPDRARLRTPQGDLGPAIAEMRAEWDAFKLQWAEASSRGGPATPPAPPLSPRAARQTPRSSS